MKRNNQFERSLDLSGDELHAYFNLLDAYYIATEGSADQKAIGAAIARMVSIGQVRKEMNQASLDALVSDNEREVIQ